MSIDAKRRNAAAAFVALLILSVWWPSPVVSINRLCCNATLGVDELSFLGREAPSWDVAFWCLAGFLLIALLVGAALVAAIWLFADAAITSWAERIQSDTIEDAIRITNRLGGGMNPALLVFFFLVAGVVYRHRRWTSYAVAMALAGLGAGLLAQIVKALVGRTRPELWLGPFPLAPPP